MDTQKNITPKKFSLVNSVLSQKLKDLTQAISQERLINAQLTQDLSKALETILKFQIELQETKSKALQGQLEERKQLLQNFEKIQQQSQIEKETLLKQNDELYLELKNRDRLIEALSVKINFNHKNHLEIEKSHSIQCDTLNKLIANLEEMNLELKMELDHLSISHDELLSQIQQITSNSDVLKNENHSLKNYINEITKYQNQLHSQSSVKA